MTIVATNWLDISITLLTVVFVIVCLLMTLIILMQRPKQEGLGAAFGGGVTDQVFGARTTNVLQKGTVYLGSMFFVIALALAILIGHQSDQAKVVKDEEPVVEESPEPTPAPVEEDVQPKSLIDELGVPEPTPEETAPEETAPEEATPEGSSPESSDSAEPTESSEEQPK